MSGRVLVTGGTGFVGSAALRALAEERRLGQEEIRALVRRAPDASGAVPGVEYLEGDLTDPRTLRGMCDGVDTVLHCASYIGEDEERCRAVNADGTRALLAEAERSGGARTVLVSTAAVYGPGPHRGITERDMAPAPASATSRTRLLAERSVLAAGGTVLRPPLVYGAGDVWLVPGIAELLERVPALPEGGRARLSLVPVDDLARLLATLARTPRPDLAGTVHHAAHPDTLTLRRFLVLLGDVLGLPLPTAHLALDDYLTLLRGTSGAITPHQVRLLGEDRWYRSPLWRRVGCPPGPGHAARLRASASWYRRFLSEAMAVTARGA